MGKYIRRFPLWQRFVFAFVCAAIIVAALVIYVNHHQQPLSEAPANPNPKQAATEQKEDQTVVRQQQAPHHEAIAPGAGTPSAKAAEVLTNYMSTQVSDGLITGPLDGQAVCAGLGGSPDDTVLHCSVVAGDKAKDDSLKYPFDAVVNTAKLTVTFCQVVTPPYPLKSQPISSACR